MVVSLNLGLDVDVTCYNMPFWLSNYSHALMDKE